MGSPRASRRRPARWARASPTPSGWPSRSGGLRASSTSPVTRSSTTGRTSLLRRRPPGGHRVGGGEPRRPPPARQAHRPLRRQPHPARRADRDGLVGGRRRTLRRLRLGDQPGRGRQRPRSHRCGDPRGAGRRPALAHRRPDPHRVRQPEQAGHPEGPRLAARSRRGPPDQAGVRLGSRCPVPGARRGRGAHARRGFGRGLPSWRTGTAGTAPRGRVTRPRRRTFADETAPSCDPTRSTGSRPTPWARSFATRQASQAAIQALAGPVPELFGGSADLSESNLTLVKDAEPFEAGEAGPQPVVRRSRARHGWRRERHRLPRRLHPLRGHVPELQRLHARLRSPRGPCRASRDLRLDARFRRARRGRSDPPAGRALRGTPRDAEPVVRSTRRRERGDGCLGPRGRAARRAGRALADAPEAAHARGHGRARPRGRREGRVRPAPGKRRGRGQGAGPAPDRDGLGAPARVRRGRGTRARFDRGSGRLAAVLGGVRRPGRGLSRIGDPRAASGSA